MILPSCQVRPEECMSMDDVRAEIDRLDHDLVRLLSCRQRYIESAARIKESIADIRVPWRIEDVLKKVRKTAGEEGLSPRIAEAVWHVLIDQCIIHERQVFIARHGLEKEKERV